MTRPEAALIDELEFRSYVHNRKMFPDVEPARWAAIFSNVPEMEEMLSTGNILDVADRATGNAPVTDGLRVGDEGGGEILSSSPLYLLASEIVDIVEFSEQLRLEEEAAAEEGAAIEASGYPDPASNPRFA